MLLEFEAASYFKSYENVELLELYSVWLEVLFESEAASSVLGLDWDS